ncbi:LysR family transcriptional regulator [Pseudomonas sp. WN033]|nr:LysR family transcriptional regulator [Pseudomonas sp. WN033]
MLNLNDLFFFVKVVEHKGFAPASRQLAIPKSTLSKRVAELEKHLGLRLIHRTSRRFVLTETGADFYRHAAAALIEAETAENIVRGRLAEPSGTVRIAASVPTAQLWLATLLPELSQAFPRIRVELDVTDRFVDLVQEGIDIALRDHFAPLPSSDLVQRRIMVQPLWLVASRAYLQQQGEPESPQALGAHQGLLASMRAPAWSLTRQDGETVEVAPLARFVANESHVLLGAATAGLGIACLPAKLCGTALKAKTLVRVLPEWIGGSVTTTLLMPHRRGQLPAVRTLADFLVEGIGK